MGEWRVKYGRVTYRYILTVIDVFSRYVWLRPLKGKHSAEISRHLEDIYNEHGPPKVLQHDQGKEFKGAVKKLMDSLQVKIIQSSPYHPQSQGKVERSHRLLRKKIMYDLVQYQKGGVNWVKHLPIYAKVMNEDPKEVLSVMSPFQVYYGRQSHAWSNQLISQEVLEEPSPPGNKAMPTEKQRLLFEHKRNRIRKRAKEATQRCIRRQNQSGRFKPSIYRLHEHVLVRVKSVHHRVSQKHFVIPGVIVAINRKLHKYKVEFHMPNSLTPTRRWFQVSDVTSVTRLEESQRQKFQPKKVDLRIPLSHEDRLENFESSNLNIRFDPVPDGNCQFAAISDQLATIGIFRSAATLREEIVANLTSHPYGVDGTPLSEYVEETWAEYLQGMAQHGTYGDHLTLQRASQIFNVQFLIVSTLGLDATSVISPSGGYFENSPVLILGHFAEGQGEHYVSLDGHVHPYIQAIQEAELQKVPQPSSLSDTELGSQSDANPPSMSDEPACIADEPGFLSQGEPVFQHNSVDQSMAPLVNMVEDAGNELGEQYLPPEVLSRIIEFALIQDMSMLGTFNQVSRSFQALLAAFYPNLYIRETLEESLELDKENDFTISIMKLYKAAGRSSGLSARIRSCLANIANG
ncbi:uncharacterized protein LOC126406426 [Epinephelus moara]|uniref:uncharacterized protein LOC126406426 n=1 Tax=Epinephelus moara TaxID=300413 RepID=UPI00214DF123|nr:uncharacterized protein LOC126406426 [Epinephelus moara]